MLSAMINACGCYHPELLETDLDEDRLLTAAAILMSKVRTIAAFSHKMTIGRPMEYPDPKLSYCRNFLHMMFSKPHHRYEPSPEVVKALSQFLILHADHEQNCSTSTVRMVGSSGANLFASVSAGVCAPLGAVPRRGQHRRHRDARQDPPGGREPQVHRREGEEPEVPAHGLRPPRLQELRSPRQDPRADGREAAGHAGRRRPAARHRRGAGRRSRSPTSTSSSGSSTPTSTSTRGSSSGRSASR